ncbi:MAG: sodium-translocating pyrophosphatase, partial [Armatimonadota bacterium]
MEFTAFEQAALWATLGSAILGLAYAFMLRSQILRASQGTEKMQQVAGQIQAGADAYLNRQFRTITWFVVLLGVGLLVSGMGQGWDIAVGRGLAFLAGCFASGLTGYMGMWLAVRGNVRTAEAARHSLVGALTVAFRSGTIAGMFTVGMGLIGATIIFMIFKERAEEVLLGFGFGGCLLALFMRVGGGIYTKAADVGADLVGKVEAGIPEDDPRNAAVIADNVGDNVGDCAGMAADIFESYEVTLVAAMILGLAAGKPHWVIFALVVRGIGVLTSIVGTYLVRIRSEEEHAMSGITRGFVWSALLSIAGFVVFAYAYLVMGKADPDWWRLLLSTTAGIFLAVVIYRLTEYYVSTERAPVQEIASSTQTGTATNILSGFSYGMESSVAAVLLICLVLGVAMVIFWGASTTIILFGISLTGLGMLTTTGIIVSMDTFGPVADNANGIGEMAGLEPEARSRMHELDAVGNTTKAATKGFAIASAVIAAVALFGSYMDMVVKDLRSSDEVVASFTTSRVSQEVLDEPAIRGKLDEIEAQRDEHGTINVLRRDLLEAIKPPINVAAPKVFIGLLIGGAMPFLFSSLLIKAVGRAAFQIINEVRRQFREIEGLWEGTAQPDSARCVDICTAAAIRELIGPGALAIIMPMVVGAFLGWPGLGGYLAGIIVCGQLLAVMLANSGGAWDNAKKLIEDGLYGGKGSDVHKQAVVGDTVGDPFKDTAGPALNPLIKVMNLVGVLIVPMIVAWQGTWVCGVVGVVGLVIVGAAVAFSKRKG